MRVLFLITVLFIILKPDVTANHYGWIEFRLCARDSRDTPLTHECLDKHLLKNVKGETRFNIGSAKGILKFNIQLPAGVKCKECVIQWKYNTGTTIEYQKVTNDPSPFIDFHI